MTPASRRFSGSTSKRYCWLPYELIRSTGVFLSRLNTCGFRLGRLLERIEQAPELPFDPSDPLLELLDPIRQS
jgi:hypothetical protein